MRGQTPDGAATFCAVEYPRLVGGLTLYVGDRFVAEELAQEALLRACRRWEHVGGLQSPGGWTWRVALNLANSHFRRRSAARRAHQRLEPNGVRAHEDPDGADAVAVRRAVAALPVRQKTVLVLRYFLDLSVEQTAQHMGASGDAVRSLTKRAVAALRTELVASQPLSGLKEVGDV